MLNRIYESFQKPRTKDGVKAIQKYTVGVSKQEMLGKIYGGSHHGNLVYYDTVVVNVKRTTPIINIVVNDGPSKNDEDSRWFLRKAEAIAFLVKLRLDSDNVIGVEEALQALE